MTEIITKQTLDNTKYITSIEIAELTGKQHKHVMEAIRRMESLFIAAKFNDVARARLVIRWEELERRRNDFIWFGPMRGRSLLKNCILEIED